MGKMDVLGILKASSELQLRQTVVSPQFVLSQELFTMPGRGFLIPSTTTL
jgi:hypothetical protein